MLKTALTPAIHGEVSPAAHLSGPVYVGKGSVIRPGVVIDGPVYIGENCQIGPNCWLRPYTTIGDGCRIGQAVEVKASIFMDGVNACHLSYIGDSVIGDHANLGCGTITANVRHDGSTDRSLVGEKTIWLTQAAEKFGAIVGDHAHTGIHTCIYPPQTMAPHQHPPRRHRGPGHHGIVRRPRNTRTTRKQLSVFLSCLSTISWFAKFRNRDLQVVLEN